MNEETARPCPRAVLDTNVALALWWFRDPALVLLRQAIEAGELQPVASLLLLAEWDTALQRLAQTRSAQQVPVCSEEATAAYLRWVTLFPHPDEVQRQALALPLCRDHEDQKILECAVALKAKWLLTRDKKVLQLRRHPHLTERLTITRPEQWVAANRV